MRYKISCKIAKTIGRLAVQSVGAILKMEHMIGRQGSVGSVARGFGLFIRAGQAENKNSRLPLPQSTFDDKGKQLTSR